MYIKILILGINIELVFEDRTFSFTFSFKGRGVSYERHFPKYFKCAICDKRVEHNGDKLKLCDEHYEEVIEYFNNKIR